jgi:hypothetical protein
MWSEMFEDASVADSCLNNAAKSGKPYAIAREYPAAYFGSLQSDTLTE